MVDTVASRELEPLAGPSVCIYPLGRGIEISRGLTGGRHARWIHFSAKIDFRSFGPSGRHETSMKLLRDLDTLGLGFAN